jgi:hypothetical protein
LNSTDRTTRPEISAFYDEFPKKIPPFLLNGHKACESQGELGPCPRQALNTNSHNLVPIRPYPQPDRHDAPWLADEPVPGMTAVINDIIVMTKHAIG